MNDFVFYSLAHKYSDKNILVFIQGVNQDP